ncbi:MAG: hypothetical protein Kow0068_05720 [Marinilabiliales bacterium]
MKLNLLYILLFIVITTNTFGQCHAYYSYWTDNNGNAHFIECSVTMSNDSITSHTWLFGDGTQSTQNNPTHHYLSDGWYQVCHIINTENNCTDTICDSLYIPSFCFIEVSANSTDVTYYGGSNGTITVIAENGVPPYNYLWSTGDTLNYQDSLQPGIYSITVCDGLGCCDSVIVEITQPQDSSIYKISGHVYAGTNFLPQGIIILNKLMADSTFKAIRYSFIENGYYEIYGNDVGNYLIYAIPYVDIEYPYTPVYLPTYYGDTMFWQNASIITLDTTSTSTNNNKNIHLFSDQSMNYGSSSIEGTIYYVNPNNYENSVYGQDWQQQINNQKLNTARNIPILLMDRNKKPIRFTLSNEYGNYIFDKVDTGKYYIHAEKAGFEMEQPIIELVNPDESLSNIDLIILNHKIIAETKNIIPKNNDYKIFPNPAIDFINIQINSENFNIIEIFNSKGIRVLQKEIKNNNKLLTINIHSLPHGTYIVRLINSTQYNEYKLIIR